MANSSGWQEVDPVDLGIDMGLETSRRPRATGYGPDDQETIDSIMPDGGETITLRRQLYAILVQVSGVRRFELYRIDKPYTTLGRSRSERINIAIDDRAVSNPHCKFSIERDEDGAVKQVVVEDQESENGTWVNGKLINRVALRDRDVVRVGETELLFIRI